jgi:hypothetical protein
MAVNSAAIGTAAMVLPALALTTSAACRTLLYAGSRQGS